MRIAASCALVGDAGAADVLRGVLGGVGRGVLGLLGLPDLLGDAFVVSVAVLVAVPVAVSVAVAVTGAMVG